MNKYANMILTTGDDIEIEFGMEIYTTLCHDGISAPTPVIVVGMEVDYDRVWCLHDDYTRSRYSSGCLFTTHNLAIDDLRKDMRTMNGPHVTDEDIEKNWPYQKG